MERIASFEVDHTILECGLYVSRRDKNTITYDLRFAKPNGGDYVENGAIHTLEHLFATYVRNSEYGESIVYFGPMGCRTGFYLITFDDMTMEQVKGLICAALEFTLKFSGEIPGASEAECGNYKEHSLEGAKKWAGRYAESLKG